MPMWERIVQTTITDHLKGEHGSIMRNRQLLKMLEKRGRVVFNCVGEKFDWRFRHSRNTMTGFGDMDTVTFGRKNRHKKAELEYRQYIMAESVSKKERLANKGSVAIIKVFEEIADWMLDDIRENFASELYVDGNATGNENRIHGIESMMEKGATLGTGSNGWADGVYQAGDTYAGVSTAHGGLGGTWNTSDWPNGDGSAEYDCWTPLLIKYDDSAFGPNGSETTWRDNCEVALRYAVAHGNRNKAQSGETDVFLMNNDMFRLFATKYAAKERIITGQNDQKYGFDKPEIQLDGATITQDFGVPSEIVYGFNVDSMELRSMQGQLFVANGPEWNSNDQSYRFAIDFYGNMKFRQPRDFVKLAKFT